MRGKSNAYFDGPGLNTWEPRLADVLDDPVIQAVMARDGIGRREIVDLAAALRARLQQSAKNSCGMACR